MKVIAAWAMPIWRRAKATTRIQAYQQAIDANPYYWLNQNKLGSVYFQLGQNQKALDAFGRVVELAPDSTLWVRKHRGGELSGREVERCDRGFRKGAED